MIEFLFFPFLAIIWMGFFAIGIFAFIFWILMLVDCAKRKFKRDNDKVVWVVILALAGVIGAVIYYFMVKRPDIH